MAIIRKFSPKENLNFFNTFINDTNPNSTYFRISEFKEDFTGGKNGFTIEGSEFLKETTELKIEIIDVNGNTIYFEPGQGIPEYYEGISKVVSVHVYDDTPIGIAEITILGELKTYQRDDGSVVEVPDVWKGVYNVKWSRQFKVNKLLSNEDKVRFFKRPTIQIDEINKPIFTTSFEVITQTGVVVGTPNVPIAGNSLRNFTQPTSYRIDSVGGDAWTGSIVGTQLQIPTLNYFPTVIDIIDKDTLIVQEPYTVNNIVQPFTATGYTASFSDTTNFVEGSILTGSFSKIKISNLKTFVGDVARVKVFRKSQSTAESFQLTQEIQLESNELLVDLDVIDSPDQFYGLLTEPVLAEYWETSSNDLQTSFTQEYLYNAVVLNGTTTPHLFYVNRELGIQTDVEYTLSFGIRLQRPPLASNYIQPFISGSRTVIVDGNPITTQVRQNITKIPGLSRYLEKNKIEANFISEDIDNAQLYFEVVGSGWYLNEISVRASQESSFSPDEITFIQIVPRILPAETFDFRFEFYDINNNYIPVRVTAQKTFSGGNLQQLNRSLRVTPTNLFFVYDNDGNSVGVNNIIFNIEKTLLTGSVLFTSGAFDSGGLLIPSVGYNGQYPGLLTNITETSATLTSANFTGSDSTVDVSFIEYNASCEDLTTTFTIGKLIDGESAKAVLVNADHNQFFYKRSTLAPTTPQTILIRANKLNIPPTSTFSIISSSNSPTVPPITLSAGSGTSTEIYSISTNTFGYLNGPTEYVFTAEDEFGNSFSDSVVIETVVDGAAANLKLSRDNHTYVAKSTGELLSSITDGNVDIDLFVGSDQIDYVNENPITTNNRWSIIGVNVEGVTPTSVTIVDGNTARIGITSFDSNLIDSGSVFITASYRDGAGVSESISRKITYNKTKKAAPSLQLVILDGNQTQVAKSTGEQITPFVTASFKILETYDGVTLTKNFDSPPTVISSAGSYNSGFNPTVSTITLPNLPIGVDSVELAITGPVTDIEGSVRPVSGSISLTKNKNAVPTVIVSANPTSPQQLNVDSNGDAKALLTNVVFTAKEGETIISHTLSIIDVIGLNPPPTIQNPTSTSPTLLLSNSTLNIGTEKGSLILSSSYQNSEGTLSSQTITYEVKKVSDSTATGGIIIEVNPQFQVITRTVFGQNVTQPVPFIVTVREGSTFYGYKSGDNPLTGSDFKIINVISGSGISANDPATSNTITPVTPSSIAGTTVSFDVVVSGSDGSPEFTEPRTHRVSITPEGQTGPGIVFTGLWEPDRVYQFSDGADSPGTARRDAVLWESQSVGVYDTYYATRQQHVSTNSDKPGTVDGGSFWQSLGTQDFFVAAKIGIFEESYIQNTLNIGTTTTGSYSSANITIAGGLNDPYISIGQTAGQDYGLPGIFIGSGSAAKLSLRSPTEDNRFNSLEWNGENLIIRGGIRQTSAGIVVTESIQRGAWLPNTIYDVGNIVQYGELGLPTSSYSATSTHTSTDNTNSLTGRPPFGPWEIFAQAGADGAPSKVVSLSATSFTVAYNQDGTNPTPTNITLIATASNFTNGYFKFNGVGNTLINEGSFTPGLTATTDTASFQTPTDFFPTPLQFRVGVAEGNTGIEVASDVITITAIKPGSDSDPRYFLTPLDGTQIKNSNPNQTLRVKIQESSVNGLNDITSSDFGIYSGSVLANTKAGITGTQYAVTASASGITGSLILTLRSGSVDVDSITLVDVTDGLGGGSIIANSLVTTRLADNTFNINPLRVTASFFTVGENPTEYTASFRISASFDNGVDRMAVSAKTGSNFIVIVANDGDGVNIPLTNTPFLTKDVNIIATFTDPITKDVNTVQETFYIVSDGKDGEDAITITNSNQAHVVPSTNDGTVVEADLVGSGTTIEVFEGITKLTRVNTSVGNGQYTVTASVSPNSSITTGSISGGQTVLVASHTAMSQNVSSSVITYTINGKRTDGNLFNSLTTQTLTKAKTGQTGAVGNNAKTIRLSATSQVFRKAKDGVITPTQIDFTASLQNMEDVTAIFTSSSAAPLTGTGNTRSLTSSSFGSSNRVTYTATADSLSDSITIILVEEGTDTIKVQLSNEVHVVTADNDGSNPVLDGSGTTIQVYEGDFLLTYEEGAGFPLPSNPGRYRITVATSGVTGNAIDGDGTTTATVGILTGMVNDVGTRTFTINVRKRNGITSFLTEVQSFAKSKAGDNGKTTPLIYAYKVDGSDSTAPINFNATFIPPTSWSFNGNTGGWSNTLQTSAGAPTHVSIASLQYTGSGENLIIPSGSWSTPVINSQTLKYTTVELLQRTGSVKPAAPTNNITYSFDNNTITGNISPWQSGSATGVGDYLWRAIATAVSNTNTDIIQSNEWQVGLLSQDGEDGIAGINAKTIRLSATSQVFRKSRVGVITPNSITFTTNRQNITEDVVYTSSPTVSLTSVTNTGATLTKENFGSNISTTVTTTADSLSDSITIILVEEGKDTVQALLSNEAHVVTSDVNGDNPVLGGSGTTIQVYEGDFLLTFVTGTGFPTTSGRYTITTGSVGVSGGAITGGGTTTANVGILTGMTADVGTRTFTINVRKRDDVTTTFTKVQSFAKSKTGLQGPGLVYRGEWSGSVEYIRTNDRRDIVLSSGIYYIAKQTNTGNVPSNNTFWDTFGSTFNSVATSFLLTENAVATKDISVGTNAAIVIQGSNNNPYISIGQSIKSYKTTGIFLGLDGGVSKLSLSGSQGLFDWDGNRFSIQTGENIPNVNIDNAGITLRQLDATIDTEIKRSIHWLNPASASLQSRLVSYGGGTNLAIDAAGQTDSINFRFSVRRNINSAQDLTLGIVGRLNGFFDGTIAGDAVIGLSNGRLLLQGRTTDPLALVVNGGRIGIGNFATEESYKLNVTGNTNISGSLNVTGSVFINGQELASVANAVLTTNVNQDIDGNKTFLKFITGSISGTSTGVVRTVTGTNSAELVRGNMGDNDQARILVGATSTNAGFLEIATADDGTEPIHVRQYTGVFTTVARTATLLDGSGNTSFPGGVTAPSFTGSLSGNATTAGNVTGTVAVTNGGTGLTSITSNFVLLGNGTGNVTTASRSGIDTRTSFPPESHTHGNITNAGAIGSTSDLPIITTTSGVLTTGIFGQTVGTFAAGNDSRFHTPVTISTANGLSLSGQALSLAAASITSAGAVTTVAQSFLGDKTFSGRLHATSGSNTAGRLGHRLGTSTDFDRGLSILDSKITTNFPSGIFLTLGRNNSDGEQAEISYQHSATTLTNSMWLGLNGNPGIVKIFRNGTVHLSGSLLSTGNITAPTFVGSLSGNATTATTAISATNVGITLNGDNNSQNIVFVNATSGNNGLRVDNAGLQYNPNTNTLFLGDFDQTTFGKMVFRSAVAGGPGTVTLRPPLVGTNYDITLPSSAGTLALTTGVGVTSLTMGTGISGSTNPITGSGTIGLTGQALSLHNLATNGFIYRSGSVIGTRTITAGTGISISNGAGFTGNPVITNTAPDQTVTISQAGATTVTGTYPDFTISSLNTTYTAGDGLSLSSGNQFSVNSTVVRTTGDQNISGNKTFNGRLHAISGSANTTPGQLGHRLGNGTDLLRGLSILDSRININTPGQNSIYLTLGRVASDKNQAEISFQYAGPNSDNNAMWLGLFNRTDIVKIRGDRKVEVSGSLQVANSFVLPVGTNKWAT